MKTASGGIDNSFIAPSNQNTQEQTRQEQERPKIRKETAATPF